MTQSISTISIDRLAHMWLVDNRDRTGDQNIDGEAVNNFISFLGDNKYPDYKDVRRWKSSLYYSPDFNVRAKKDSFAESISKFVEWIAIHINKTEPVNDVTAKPSILETTDYSIFKQMKGNRPLNDGIVKKLVRSMKEESLPVPIIVNESYEVVDGQHRLEACKQTDMPVYYIVVPGADENTCKRLNQDQTGWKQKDFLNYYAQLGSKPASRILEVANRTGTNIKNVIQAAGKSYHILNFTFRGHGSQADWYDDETFSEEDAEIASKCIRSAFIMMEAVGGEKNTKKDTFISVWSIFYHSGVVDDARMVRALTGSNSDMWKLNKSDLIRKIVSVYNRKRRAPYLDIEYNNKYSVKIIRSDKNCWRDFH